MEHHQIKIRKIKLKDLDEFSQNALNDPAYQNIAPISLVRAGSQAKNPHAEPDDITLLVALCNGRCVGYHGLLPGILKVDENEYIKYLIEKCESCLIELKAYMKLNN